MGFVVEIVSRSGRVQERHVVDDAQAWVGRAYDNDIILADPHVAPRHVRLTRTPDGFEIDVLDGDARTEVRGRTPGSSVAVSSGDGLTLGRTYLRVYDRGHQVAETLPFNAVDEWLVVATQPHWLAVLLLAFIAFSVGNSWLESYQPMAANELALAVLMAPVGVLVWALLWALVTRVSRGEPRFAQHAVAAVVTALLVGALGWVEALISFNARSPEAVDAFGYVGLWLGVSVPLYISLRIAFRQPQWARLAIAHGSALAVMIYVALSAFPGDFDFLPSPEYESTLLPNAMQLGDGASREVFLEEASELFDVLPEPADG